jgi:hypothetical protein
MDERRRVVAASWRTLVATVALAGAVTACAHGGDTAGAPLSLGELGDDLPQPKAAKVKVALFSVDAPVGALCGHPEAKAVVDRDLPGLTSRPEYMFFKHMSLRQLQAASNGRMSAADLQKVADDLAALPPPAGRRARLIRVASS